MSCTIPDSIATAGSSVHLIERHALNDGTVGYLTSSNLCFFIGYLGDRKDSLEGSMCGGR